MRMKLRLVQLANGDYAVQVKGRTWFDLFWHTYETSFQFVDAARRYMDAAQSNLLSTYVAAVIEERTL